jgi:TolB-like protein
LIVMAGGGGVFCVHADAANTSKIITDLKKYWGIICVHFKSYFAYGKAAKQCPQV